MRNLFSNDHADMNMILAAIVMAIVFAIGIVIIFSIMGGLDTSTIDANFGDANETPAANATDSLQESVETFYTIGPIALIVVAAVGILSYVLLLRRT